MTGLNGRVYRFGEFEVREREFCVFRDDASIPVEPKAYRVLLFLLQNPHRLITKNELLDAVWAETAVSENSLTRSVALLRKLLGDDTHEPRYIATVPTVGYRFLCDVKVAEDGFLGTVSEQQHLPIFETDISSKSEEKQPIDRRRPSRALRLVGLGTLAVIIVPIGIFLIRGAVNKHAATKHRVSEQRVTSNSPEAPVEYAVVSPDGKLVAYSDPTGLYLRVIASGETRRWAVPKGFVANPDSWFPDGTHLLVTRLEGMPPKASLWKLSLLGGDPRKLLDNAAAGAVSPDATRIAFLSFHFPSWGHELWIMGADGSNPHKIAEATRPAAPGYLNRWILPPAWSPNSRRIACMERYGVAGLAPASTDLSSLWTRDADGGDLQMIFKDAWMGPRLAWAPDGRILFASRANPASERDDEDMRSIRVNERTGKAVGQPQFVTAGAGTIGGISVTSDGKRVVLWRTGLHDQAFISEFDANTRKWKTPRRLTLDANANQATAWLSDSRTVLFVSNRNGPWTLFKQAIDETTAEILVEGHSLYLPRLSADGSQVLYGSQSDPADPSAPVSLMRLPVAGGAPQLVARDGGIGNFQCARLPSTLCIFDQSRGNDQIFVSFDPERGVGQELLKSSGTGRNWTLAPDGKTLAVFPSVHSIRFFHVENGAAREDKTIMLSDWLIPNGDWSADGEGLLIPSVTPAGLPVMLEVNRAGKATVVLEGTTTEEFEFMIQSPDGHYGILGAAVPGDSNAWMIDNF